MFSLKMWLVFLFLLWIFIVWTRRKYYLLALKVPGQFGYPLLGDLFPILNKERLLYYFKALLKKHGPFMVTWVGPYPVLVVSDPQCARDILTSAHCVNKYFNYSVIESLVGVGLLNLREPDWGVYHKFLKPALGHKVLISFLPIFNRETSALLRQFDLMVDKAAVNIYPIVQKRILNISAQTILENDVNNEDSLKDKTLLESITMILEIMATTNIFPWFTYESNKIPINVAIEQLKRRVFNLKNVDDHSLSMIIAALETSTNTLAHTLILLAMFPDHQEKVFEELKEIFPEQGDFDVTYEETQKMIYLNMVLNESIRLLPPIPLIARQVTGKVQLSNGIQLPKGLQIVFSIIDMHRSKDIWGSNAETFNPENFLPSNLKKKHSYSFLPFSKGIRDCIGWRYAYISMKIVLSKLIRNYKFSTKSKLEDLKFMYNITLQIKPLPLLKVERRV